MKLKSIPSKLALSLTCLLGITAVAQVPSPAPVASPIPRAGTGFTGLQGDCRYVNGIIVDCALSIARGPIVQTNTNGITTAQPILDELTRQHIAQMSSRTWAAAPAKTGVFISEKIINTQGIVSASRLKVSASGLLTLD